MSKSKHKNFRVEDHKYLDGYGVDKRKTSTIDKRKDRRFERALRTKNADALLEDDYMADRLEDETEGYRAVYHDEDDV